MRVRYFIVAILGVFLVQGLAKAQDIDRFEAFVKEAREVGVTHIDISENLPPAMWQFERSPGDPYPAWFAYQPSLLKVFPPKMLQPYVDMEYVRKIQQILAERSKILQKYGLKAYYSTNEPHILPETFFEDYPLLRGPRVDQVNRSRTARFAPCTDRPQVQKMYSEAMQQLLETAPAVEKFSFLTSDSGAGFCWSPGLYPGKNGPSWCKDHPMKKRVRRFMLALKEGAEQAGQQIQVEIHGIKPRQWMTASFDNPREIARQLPEGFAIEGLEGPDAEPVRERHLHIPGRTAFSPVVGVEDLVGTTKAMMAELVIPEAPLLANPPAEGEDGSLEIELYQHIQQEQPSNESELMQVLHKFAAEQVGPEHADDLLHAWIKIDEVKKHLASLNFGSVLYFGPVLTRWINRPMVPYPEDLTQEEKGYYRPYLLQAKGEEQANDLIDIQGMHMFKGYGARLLVQRVTELAMADLNSARQSVQKLIQNTVDDTGRWEVFDKRLQVVQSLIRTVDNAVGYQALLDLSKSDGTEPEPNPVLGATGSWKRKELLRIARNEMDNAAELRELLLNTDEPLINTAEQETIRELGPDLPNQLKRKVDVMAEHWLDYNQLFTRPNQ